MPPMRGRLLLILIALCAALAVAGCGSDDDSSADTSTPAASESGATTTEDSGEEEGAGDESAAEEEGAGDETATEEEDSGEEAADSGDQADAGDKPKVTIPDGPPPEELEIVDLTEGSGSPVKDGDSVTVNYIGFGYESKKEFDASWGAEPITFTLGEGQVIKGWDQGIVGMKPGGRREMTVPPDLGYGAKGYPGIIGKNETLIFVVDLVSAESK